MATQLARWRGAHVIGTASAGAAELARGFGVEQVLDPATPFGESIEPVDLVFDTVGGEALMRSADVLRGGGRLVAVAEEPPAGLAQRVLATYFIVEPDREQLVELATLAAGGTLRPAIDTPTGFSTSTCFPAFRASRVYSRWVSRLVRTKTASMAGSLTRASGEA